MPYIDVKLSRKADELKKVQLKSRLGEAVAILNKPEKYLMVGIEDDYTIYFGGKEMDNGAYISVSIYGHADGEAFNRLTGEICNILNDLFEIPPDCVYISYHETENWGFNGKNFGH